MSTKTFDKRERIEVAEMEKEGIIKLSFANVSDAFKNIEEGDGKYDVAECKLENGERFPNNVLDSFEMCETETRIVFSKNDVKGHFWLVCGSCRASIEHPEETEMIIIPSGREFSIGSIGEVSFIIFRKLKQENISSKI